MRSNCSPVSDGHAVAPELLRYVDDYIEETNLDDALRSHLDSNSNLIVFCREFFAQLFANVVGRMSRAPWNFVTAVPL